MIPEKLAPHFKPGKALREAVDAQAATAADAVPQPTSGEETNQRSV
jgi:integration host factor subunit beta